MCRWVLALVAAVTAGVVVADEVCRCGSSQLPSTRTLTVRFTYKAVVPNIPRNAKVVELWLPLPSDSEWQTVRDIQVSSPVPHRITQEPKFGNRMVYVRDEGRGTRDAL
ncbi:MAG: hypothetical protein ACK4I8_08460, partial [Armatimonadota bacterium]